MAAATTALLGVPMGKRLRKSEWLTHLNVREAPGSATGSPLASSLSRGRKTREERSTPPVEEDASLQLVQPAAYDFLDRPLVYIAAPYTNPDPVENTHKLIRAVDALADQGIVTPVAPHLTLLWHMVTPRPLAFWYAYDLAMLARCDACFRLPGPSTGADKEVEFAAERAIPVFHDEEELNLWARGWRLGTA